MKIKHKEVEMADGYNIDKIYMELAESILNSSEVGFICVELAGEKESNCKSCTPDGYCRPRNEYYEDMGDCTGWALSALRYYAEKQRLEIDALKDLLKGQNDKWVMVNKNKLDDILGRYVGQHSCSQADYNERKHIHMKYLTASKELE
jgi:hypothetical protein